MNQVKTLFPVRTMLWHLHFLALAPVVEVYKYYSVPFVQVITGIAVKANVWFRFCGIIVR